MNQLDIFSQKVNNRHIGYKGPVTEAMLDQLVDACVHSSIPYHRAPAHTIFDIVYWVSNFTTTHCDDNGIVDMEWKSGLMDWSWFVYLPWDQFLALVQGNHEFKDQPYYDQLLADYDKPFKENDIANGQMQMESLFDAKLYSVIQ